MSNAGYFTDGHGIVEGDLIMLEGQVMPAVILAIDYVTNTLTVDTPLTWDADTGVALGYHGDAPDQGAFEHASVF